MKLAAQLFTLRDHTTTRKGFEKVLEDCAKIGYEGVQISAVGCMHGDPPEVDAATAKKMLDDAGLVCCATHRATSSLLYATDHEIEFHQILAAPYTAVGSIGGDFGREPSSYKEFLREARPAAKKLHAAGIRFGYHNHSHEFVRDADKGKTHFELLLDPENDWLQMEIDTYWVAHAGASPAKILKRLAGRIWAVHFKDMEVTPDHGPVMAPVGEGNLDWPEIIDACKTGGTEWAIVEQDTCRRDPIDCLRSSYEFLKERVS